MHVISFIVRIRLPLVSSQSDQYQKSYGCFSYSGVKGRARMRVSLKKMEPFRGWSHLRTRLDIVPHECSLSAASPQRMSRPVARKARERRWVRLHGKDDLPVVAFLLPQDHHSQLLMTRTAPFSPSSSRPQKPKSRTLLAGPPYPLAQPSAVPG